jgi:hypothetical protein
MTTYPPTTPNPNGAGTHENESVLNEQTALLRTVTASSSRGSTERGPAFASPTTPQPPVLVWPAA